MKQGDVISGFAIKKIVRIPEIRLRACIAKHEKSGADFIHLINDDSENTYAIALKTPPYDSTGVPHIIEHSVLAGSKRYPLKDVFNELIKGSLQTFLNAFTYPDKTVYPVASQIKKDFFNLASVYTDLVFNPRLLKETFWQEAHHLGLSDPDDIDSELKISGVVYNEMKGAYSSVNSLAFKLIQENLYPQTIYAFDSGGDPQIIPQLTYEAFCKFHRQYYSPANALFFVYGNIPTDEHLRFIDETISSYKKENITDIPKIVKQSRWHNPREKYAYYPIAKEDKPTTIVNVAWMLTKTIQTKETILLSILSALLIGSSASPLRKALIESKLGEDLSPVSGMENELQQTLFAIGLRGVAPADSAKVEHFILETLARIADEGFDEELIEGILHQTEFAGKEIIRKSYPYGITLMGTVLSSWLYGGNLLAGLKFPSLIAQIRKDLQKQPQMFNSLIKKHLLDNRHRLCVIMEPDAEYIAKREAENLKEISQMKQAMSVEDIEKIRAIGSILSAYQSSNDDSATTMTLPSLEIADIPDITETIPTQEITSPTEAYTILEHDIFTNGVCYLELAFDISGIDAHQQTLLPIFANGAINLGTSSFRYDEMAKKIALYTGGIGAHLACGAEANNNNNNGWRKLIVRTKILSKNIEPAIELISELLLDGNFNERQRLEEIIVEARNSMLASVVPSGHLFAKMSAMATISSMGALEETWHGRTQLLHLNQLVNHPKRIMENDKLVSELEDLRRRIFRNDGLVINLVASKNDMEHMEKMLSSTTKKLYSQPNLRRKTLV